MLENENAVKAKLKKQAGKKIQEKRGGARRGGGYHPYQ